MTAGFIANHLWQSSLFLAVVALLTLALRRNRAQVRYRLWLAASLKFLVPFAALVALGSLLPWPSSATIPSSPMSVAIDAMSQPFSPSVPGTTASPTLTAPAQWPALPLVLAAIWFVGGAALLMTWFARWRRVAAAVRNATIVESGRELEILRRLDAGLPLLASDTSLEPGVVGILRPVLLWPRSIGERLSDEQIDAIFVHELAHIRRRDNLAAALHMVVQAICWFHPLVWWVGARLIDERERACDEEVIRQGSEPQVYAESILKTCEFSIESPVACVSGVTGSDLKKRIEQIMRREAETALNVWKRCLLTAAGAVAIAAPMVAGALGAAQGSGVGSGIGSGVGSGIGSGSGRTFEVASVKVNKSGVGPSGMRFEPSGRFVATNVSLRGLISNAYGGPLQGLLRDQLVGGPSWIDAERFDVLAKAEGDLPRGPDSPLPSMIRALLAERFNLVVHTEKRDLPIYALVIARTDRRTGPQIKPSAFDCTAGRGRGAPPPPPPAPVPGERPQCGIRFLVGNISAGGVTMAQLANALSRLPAVNRIVEDRTGLAGLLFDLDLTWTPEQREPVDPDGPSIFTAVQEQLGLKLSSQTSPTDVLVIDRVDRLNAEDEFVSAPFPPPPPLPPPRS